MKVGFRTVAARALRVRDASAAVFAALLVSTGLIFSVSAAPVDQGTPTAVPAPPAAVTANEPAAAAVAIPPKTSFNTPSGDCEAPPPQDAGNQPLIPALKGIVFLHHKRDLLPEGRVYEGLDTSGVERIDTEEFHRAVCGWLGRPLTVGDLNELSNRVVRWYRDHGRPVVDVLAPEQDITSGTLQLLVLESELGQILTEGNKYFSDDLLKSYLRIQPGEEFDSDRLLVDMTAINQNPFRQVDLVYQRGERLGTTDLVLRTDDRWPYRVFVGYDNTGNRTTGFDRWTQGFNLGNVFGLDQQFSYQLTTDQEFYTDPQHARITTHDVAYVVPLPWDDRLIFTGEYSDSHPTLVQPFNLDGITINGSVRYAMPLQRWGDADQEVQIGADYKKSNNNFAFGGFLLSTQSTEVMQLAVQYSLTYRGTFGNSSAILQGFYSPGGLTDDNTVSAFANGGVFDASPDYEYMRVDLRQEVNLPYGMTYAAHFIGQLTSGNLLSSEQLQLGGAGTIRGYIESVAGGSRGMIFQSEIRSPPISLLSLMGKPNVEDQFQALFFQDYGRVGDLAGLPGGAKFSELASVGFGARYSIDRYLTFRFDYGFPVTASDSTTRAQVGHFGLTLAY